MNKLLLAILMLALTAGGAQANPLLRSNIVVTTPVVTVGDMFEGADIYAEQPLFRSPAPGTSGRVSLDAIRVATAKIGLTDYRSPEAGAVTVARFGQQVDAPLLADLIEQSLRQRGLLRDGVDAEIGFSGQLPMMTADTNADPATLLNLNYLSGSGQFAARFRISGQANPVELTGYAQLVVSVPHLVDSLPANAIIGPNDVEMRSVAVRTADTGSFSALDQVIGMQLKRPARAGKMLQPGDIEEPSIVHRNEPVTIIYRSGPLTLTVRGQALSDAAEGETLQVLNFMSSKVLSALATAPGTVTLATSPADMTTAIR